MTSQLQSKHHRQSQWISNWRVKNPSEVWTVVLFCDPAWGRPSAVWKTQTGGELRFYLPDLMNSLLVSLSLHPVSDHWDGLFSTECFLKNQTSPDSVCRHCDGAVTSLHAGFRVLFLSLYPDFMAADPLVLMQESGVHASRLCCFTSFVLSVSSYCSSVSWELSETFYPWRCCFGSNSALRPQSPVNPVGRPCNTPPHVFGPLHVFDAKACAVNIGSLRLCANLK